MVPELLWNVVVRHKCLLVRAVAVPTAARQLVVGCLLGCGALDVVPSLEDGLLDVFRLDLCIVVLRREFLRVLVPRGIRYALNRRGSLNYALLAGAAIARNLEGK